MLRVYHLERGGFQVKHGSHDLLSPLKPDLRQRKAGNNSTHQLYHAVPCLPTGGLSAIGDLKTSREDCRKACRHSEFVLCR
jgi:hypothetical protein